MFQILVSHTPSGLTAMAGPLAVTWMQRMVVELRCHKLTDFVLILEYLRLVR